MAGKDEEREIPTDPEEIIEDATDNDESFDLDGSSDEDVDALFDKAAEADDNDEGEGEDSDAEDDELGESDDEEDSAADKEDNAEAEGKDKVPDADKKKPVEPAHEEMGGKPDEALAAETAKRVALETQVKKTLEVLGIKVDDGNTIEALEKAAAEAEGVPLEEYRKKVREETEIAAAREQARRQKFEALAAGDLAELKKSFPNVLEKKHIRDCFKSFDDFAKFGRLRDAGIAAKEAYLAVNGDEVLLATKNAAQKKAADNKGHIKSAVPKGATDESVAMPEADLKEWKDIFPELSDKEIRKLYRETS